MKDMSENNNSKDKEIKISSDTEELINSKSPEDLKRVDKIQNLQKKHAEDKKKMREELSELEDKLLELGNKVESKEDEALRKDKEIQALRTALLNQKKFSAMTENERQMSESELIGAMALEIIDKRLAERYGKK